MNIETEGMYDMWIQPYELEEVIDCINEHPKGVMKVRIREYKQVQESHLLIVVTRPDSYTDAIYLLFEKPEDNKLHKSGKKDAKSLASLMNCPKNNMK